MGSLSKGARTFGSSSYNIFPGQNMNAVGHANFRKNDFRVLQCYRQKQQIRTRLPQSSSVVFCGRNLVVSLQTNSSKRRRKQTISFAAENDSNIYQGQFGTWKVEPRDIFEVTLYRASLSTVSAAFAFGTLQALLTEFPFPTVSSTVAAVIGDVALGVALTQIHIYVTPLKRFIQGLWLLGTIGGIYILLSNVQSSLGTLSLPQYVAEHPSSMWLVGFSFAALTGITFKEGICYGKPEAFLLTLIIPVFCLLHLFGGERVDTLENIIAVLLTVSLGIFAGRKWSQPIVDDIGDKSVFMMQSLPEKEREKLLQSRSMQSREVYDAEEDTKPE